MTAFEWKYTVLTVKAELSDSSLKVKQGIRTFELAVHQIRMLYLEKMPGSPMAELILVTETESGKQKKFRFYSDENEPGLPALADELARRRPGIDLRNLPRDEALAKMKVADTAKIALYAVPVILLSVMGLLFGPLLLHGLDSGSAVVKVEDLAAGKMPDSHNVTISGRALDSGLKESTTKKGRTTTRLFFPLVGQDWNEGDPVHVLVEAPDLTDADLNRVLERPQQKGIIRNILWEGPTNDQVRFFREKYGLNMAEDVLLIEVDADPKTDLYIFLFAYGITLAVVIGIVIFMRVKMFK